MFGHFLWIINSIWYLNRSIIIPTKFNLLKRKIKIEKYIWSFLKIISHTRSISLWPVHSRLICPRIYRINSIQCVDSSLIGWARTWLPGPYGPFGSELKHFTGPRFKIPVHIDRKASGLSPWIPYERYIEVIFWVLNRKFILHQNFRFEKYNFSERFLSKLISKSALFEFWRPKIGLERYQKNGSRTFEMSGSWRLNFPLWISNLTFAYGPLILILSRDFDKYQLW